MKTLSVALSFVVLLLTLPSADAQGTREQRRACRADAMRLCAEFIPIIPAITACMERNFRKLSPACRRQFK